MPKERSMVVFTTKDGVLSVQFRASYPAWIQREWEFTASSLEAWKQNAPKKFRESLEIVVNTCSRQITVSAGGKSTEFQGMSPRAAFLALEVRELFLSQSNFREICCQLK